MLAGDEVTRGEASGPSSPQGPLLRLPGEAEAQTCCTESFRSRPDPGTPPPWPAFPAEQLAGSCLGHVRRWKERSGAE